jgi:Fic family protein
MQKSQKWIWQNAGWPDFSYDIKQLLSDISALSRLIGALEMTCRTLAGEVLVDTQARVLANDAIETSAIEGEMLRRSSVCTSI